MRINNKFMVAAALLHSAGSALAAPDFSISVNSTVAGGLSDDSFRSTALGGHDPNENFTVQGIDVALNARVNDYLEGFANVNVFIDTENEYQAENEEAFAKLKNLPLGFEVRGGRFLNRFGPENNVHLHGWDYVAARFSTSLLLGEEGLTTDGGEVSWLHEYSKGDFIISASFGDAFSEEHGHGEEDEDEEGEEHDDEEDESQELSFYTGNVFSTRAQLRYNSSDFFQHKIGLNLATGENGFGRDSQLYAVDYNFTWRENGLESGGKEITAGFEYFYRDTDFVDEEDSDIRGSDGQSSISANTSYAWNENWRLAARYEYLQGVANEGFNLDSRQRASLAVTYSRQLDEDWGTHARVQYNNDRVGGSHSNSAFLQIGFSYGGNEVR